MLAWMSAQCQCTFKEVRSALFKASPPYSLYIRDTRLPELGVNGFLLFTAMIFMFRSTACWLMSWVISCQGEAQLLWISKAHPLVS